MLPDVEQIVSLYLRSVTEVTDLVGQRVYTQLPNSPTFPLVKLTRFGGAPVFNRPLHLDRALLQFDAYGGNKRESQQLAEMVRAALADPDFVGLRELDGDPIGVVTGVDFGDLRWLPDSSYTPAKPRYVFDIAVFTHPAPAVAS